MKEPSQVAGIRVGVVGIETSDIEVSMLVQTLLLRHRRDRCLQMHLRIDYAGSVVDRVQQILMVVQSPKGLGFAAAGRIDRVIEGDTSSPSCWQRLCGTRLSWNQPRL